jgi:hypothetical protein
MGRLMLLEYRNDQKYTVKMMSFLGHDWFFFARYNFLRASDFKYLFFKLPIQN